LTGAGVAVLVSGGKTGGGGTTVVVVVVVVVFAGDGAAEGLFKLDASLVPLFVAGGGGETIDDAMLDGESPPAFVFRVFRLRGNPGFLLFAFELAMTPATADICVY
jgi:hypothetical protein